MDSKKKKGKRLFIKNAVTKNGVYPKEYVKRDEIYVDNPIFRIHCSFTAAMLMGFSVIITMTQFVGQPIRCLIDKDIVTIPIHVINTYCWATTTFLIPDHFNRPEGSAAHPGLGNDYGLEKGRKYYTYYQWVCFILFFQALLCYFPKWLWGTWERGLMKTIVSGLNIGLLKSEDEKKNKKQVLIEYLTKYLHQHNLYAFSYWFCESLCCINVVFQMFLMDAFLNGDFLKYGLTVMMNMADEDQINRSDHMIYVFPRVTKCIFRLFGPSGSIERKDALCILPLNIVNEKTYIFLWFWFIILGILTLGIVIFRILICAFPTLRQRLIYIENRMVPLGAIESVSKNVSVGDWWVLYMLGRNIDPQIYKDVIVDFAKKNDREYAKKTFT